MTKNIILLIFISLGIMVCRCTIIQKTKRVYANEVTDLADKWNDTDSRLVAEKMIDDALNSHSLKNYTEKINPSNQLLLLAKLATGAMRILMYRLLLKI